MSTIQIDRKTHATRSIIGKMLREEIQKNLCDSGFIGGYAYEDRRRIKSYTKYPIAFPVADHDLNAQPAILKSTYHYLTAHLTYDKDTTRRLTEFLKKNPEMDMDHFVEAECVNDMCGFPLTDDEDFLDSTLFCWVYTTEDDEHKAVLTIHGGCDTRWGWTRPKVFDVHDDDGFVQDLKDCYASCDCGCVGTIDGGNTWEDTNPCDGDGFYNSWPDTWKMETSRKCVCTKCGEQVSFDWYTR